VLKQLKRFFTDARFSKRKDFLRSLPFCKGLANRELGYLLQSFHSRTYHEGEVLFLEGDIGRALFVVESGQIELSKLDKNGKSHTMSVMGPGNFLGEMALLEQLPRSASAKALEKSTLLLLYRSKLDSILHFHPRIGVSIMAHLARLLSARLRKTSEKLSDAGTERAESVSA
jgi:CRP/FNR family cyclic AMP-dependent transcriptional regulator